MSHGPSRHQTTTIQALMSLLKGYIGTGILAMPKAFSDSGYVFGVAGTVVIGLLCNCCIHMLVEINELFCSKPDEPPFDYEELAQVSFENGPKGVRKYAKLSKTILVICLFLTQLGFCCAYALFVAKNLLQFAINIEIGNWNEGDIKMFLVILLPVMIALNFIKSIRHLAMGSTFANVIQLTSLVIIAYNLVTDVPSITERKPIGNKLPQFVSTTVFTYEGITVTMPLYRSMKKRDNFGKRFGVINLAIIFVIILYCTVGFLGYLKYGEDVAASISLSLPNGPLYDAVRLMYALAITLSYPLQMYVAIHLMWPPIRNLLCESQRSELFVGISEYVFRAILVSITFALAAFIPELDLVIELIGAFSCSAVAIIIPTILHMVTFSGRRQGIDKAWLFVKDLFIMSLGLLAFTTGTYFSLHDIINRLTSGEPFELLNNATTMASIMFNNDTSTTTTTATSTSLLYNGTGV